MATSLSTDTYAHPQSFSLADRQVIAGEGWPYPASLRHQNEHRQFGRRPLKCRLLLLEQGVRESDTEGVIPGECLNVGNGGLYATVPLGYGVTTGQRYTFRMMIDERGPEPGEVQIVSQQGVVSRTELLVGTVNEQDRVGIAVRFAGNRTGVIPMPA